MIDKITATEAEKKEILQILADFAKGAKVYAFGSRVKGTARKISDLDLAFDFGGNMMTFRQKGDLKDAFQESDLSFRVDVIDYNDLSDNFRKIVDEQKVEIK